MVAPVGWTGTVPLREADGWPEMVGHGTVVVGLHAWSEQLVMVWTAVEVLTMVVPLVVPLWLTTPAWAVAATARTATREERIFECVSECS